MIDCPLCSIKGGNNEIKCLQPVSTLALIYPDFKVHGASTFQTPLGYYSIHFSLLNDLICALEAAALSTYCSSSGPPGASVEELKTPSACRSTTLTSYSQRFSSHSDFKPTCFLHEQSSSCSHLTIHPAHFYGLLRLITP